jgi:hypothetical protein
LIAALRSVMRALNPVTSFKRSVAHDEQEAPDQIMAVNKDTQIMLTLGHHSALPFFERVTFWAGLQNSAEGLPLSLDCSVTVPSHPAPRSRYEWYDASVAAPAKLARDQWHRLEGWEHQGGNAVFTRDGVREECFPETPVPSYVDLIRRVNRYQGRFAAVPGMRWVEVEL